MGKLQALTCIFAGIAAVGSLAAAEWARETRIDTGRTLDRLSSNKAAKFIALDGRIKSDNVTAVSKDDGVDLTIDISVNLYNSGEEPIYLYDTTYLADSYEAGSACFQGGQTEASNWSVPEPTALTPKQLTVFHISGVYHRKWRVGMKDASFCSDYGHLVTQIQAPYAYVAFIRFMPFELHIEKGGKSPEIFQLSPNKTGEASMHRHEPTIYLDEDPFNGHQAIVDDKDTIREMVLANDPPRVDPKPPAALKP